MEDRELFLLAKGTKSLAGAARRAAEEQLVERTAQVIAKVSKIATVRVGSDGAYVVTVYGHQRRIPNGWGIRVADDQKGIVFYDPAAPEANNIRIANPNAKNPNGYIVRTEGGQRMDASGHMGNAAGQAAYHIDAATPPPQHWWD